MRIKIPKTRTVKEMKEGIARHMKGRYVRRSYKRAGTGDA